MKRYLLAIILLGLNLVLHAQNGYWEEAKGPYGGEGHLFLASNGKLIYSSFVSGMRTCVSFDNGVSWNQIPNIVIDSSATGNFAITAGNGGNFYKTLRYSNGVGHVYRSSDNGETWNYTFSADSIPDFVETPNGILIGTNGNKLLRSADGGQNWNVVFEGDSINSIGPLEVGNGGNTWAYFGQDSLLRSKDSGQTWSKLFAPITGTEIHVTNNGTIIISGTQGLYRSNNNGISYQKFIIDTTSGAQKGTFCTLSSGRVLYSGDSYSGTKNLFYSDNNGTTWSSLGAPSQVVRLANIELSDGTIFCNRVRGLYRSTDGGLTWEFSSKGIRSYISKLFFASTDTIYAGQVGNIQRTFDGGENWEKISHDSFERGIVYGLYDDKKLIFMLNERLYVSPDGGNTQLDITPPVQISGPNTNYGNFDFIAAVNPATKTFFASNPLKSFRSTNEGQSWEEIPDITRLRDIQFHSNGSIYARGGDSGWWGANLYKSTDDGSSWEIVLDSVTNMCISKSGSVFAFKQRRLFKWDEISSTWLEKNTHMAFWPNVSSYILSNSQGFLFVYDASNDRILMSVNEGDTWQSQTPLSSAFNLEQFPIPFSAVWEIGPDEHLYLVTSAGMFRSSKSTLEGAFLRGQIHRDEDDDCLTYETNSPLKNWGVKATNEADTYTTTNQHGEYVMLLDTGIYNVSVAPINGIWWDVCDSLKTVALEQIGESDTLNFSALPLANCPLISVNVATPQLRRCFDNSVYVEFCNQGTETADSAWVDVTLDPFLTLVSTAQPHEVQANGAIRFFIGDVPSGDCGQFQLTVYVNCDSTVLGQTHCITARGFPDTLCTVLPAWSGANIRASATCQDSILQFKLENDGTAPSQTLEYIIIEDDVVLFSGQKNYTTGESITMEYPANGSTWRIESAQEPGHPFSFLALAFAEGCGGFGSLGFINQFPVNGSSPSWHRMCVENIGAYDPNDKQGFPLGTGSEHNIRPGQTIDYLVRFQNTGTDTAFTVVIRDTLSAFLDPLSIRPGASSHAYTWSLSGQGVINFTFNNIMLPDSNVNEPASNGFVQFSITPYLDVPLGSVIENDAAIYFDFNEPIITNTTWHTIQKSPLTSALWSEPQKTAPSLLVWPNPFNERISVRLNQKTSGSLLLKIYDSRGTLVAQKATNGPEIELNARQLPAGLYWAEVRDAQGSLLGNGKLVKE